MTTYRIELRRDTAANWASVNPVLLAGEPAFESDTNLLKIGDGSTAYNDLAYAGSTMTDGGAITGTVPYGNLPVGTTANTVAAGNDSRFTNSRTPTAHHTTHESGGTDEVSLAQSQVVGLTTDLSNRVNKTTFTAKGQILVATGSGTFAVLTVGSNGQSLVADSTQSTGLRYATPGLMLTPIFSYTGPIHTGAFTFRWYNDTGQSLTIDTVRASLGTAPTGSSAIFDVLKNGTTIFTTTSNRPTITAGTNTATGGVPDTPTVASGDYLTISIAQIGSTVSGSDLSLTVLMH